MPVWVLIGAVSGILAGVFFGDGCAALAPVGKAYVMLLQAVVYPYIVCSLVHGLGSIRPEHARRLFRRGWVFFVIAWGVTFGAIFILSSAIPRALAPAVIDPGGRPAAASHFLELLIPANFFLDLSRNYVPAVVVFSVLYGIALQRFKNKESLLGILDVVRKASVSIWNWVVRLAPFAAFALFADTAGTLAVENLESIAVYLVLFLAGTLLLAFWVLPGLVSALAGVPAKRVVKEIREGVLLSVVTTLSVVSIPYIIEAARKLAKEAGIEDGERDEIVKTTVSIAYPLGQLGNFFVFLFILFAAYLLKTPLGGSAPYLLAPMTLLSCIGSPSSTVNAVVFIGSWLHLPPAAAQLYTETMVITRYGQVVLSVFGFGFLTVLVTLSFYGKLKIRPGRMITALLLPAGLMALIALGGSRVEKALSPRRTDPYLSFRLDPTVTSGVDARRYRRGQAPEAEGRDLRPGESTLQRVQRTGVLRVGYNENVIPFSYLNREGELVGYDIAFAYELARALNARLVFVPFRWNALVSDLKACRFDIAMSGIYVTEKRLREVTMSKPYFSSPVALIVRSPKTDLFLSREAIDRQSDFRVTVFDDPVLVPLSRSLFGKAEISVVPDYDGLPSLSDFDAALWTLEQAAAFARAHEGFHAVVPENLSGRFLLAYLMPPKSEELARFVNYWLDLKKAQGFTGEMEDYWIRGNPPPSKARRWSVLRNVLRRAD